MKKKYSISIIGLIVIYLYSMVLGIAEIQINSVVINLLELVVAVGFLELLLFTISKDERLKPIIRKIALYLFAFFLFASILCVIGEIKMAI